MSAMLHQVFNDFINWNSFNRYLCSSQTNNFSQVIFKILCYFLVDPFELPGRVAQSVGHLTRKSGVLGSILVWQHTFISPSAFSRRAVVSYWRKYVHKVLVDRLGGLSLPRKSVVRLTDCPDMTLDVNKNATTTTKILLNYWFHLELFWK